MTDLTNLGTRSTGRYAAGVLVLATLLAFLVGLPAPMPGLLSLSAAAAAGFLLLCHRRRGGLDAVLVGVGGSLVGIVATGMGLSLSGLGLHETTWPVGMACLAVVSVVVDLALSIRRAGSVPVDERPASWRWQPVLRVAPWVAASAIVVVVAVTVSTRSLSTADQPPLAMTFGTIDGRGVQVVVSAGEAAGPLELRATSDGTHVRYPLLATREDGSRTTTVPLPRHGRFVITLHHPHQKQPLRTLILDR